MHTKPKGIIFKTFSFMTYLLLLLLPRSNCPRVFDHHPSVDFYTISLFLPFRKHMKNMQTEEKKIGETSGIIGNMSWVRKEAGRACMLSKQPTNQPRTREKAENRRRRFCTFSRNFDRKVLPDTS